MSVNGKKIVSLKIDGIPISVPEGTLITKAAEQNGIDIPVFCGYEKLKAWAGCRICLVEVGLPRVIEKDGVKETTISKLPKLQAACAMEVSEGMEVWTETEPAVENRKRVLEFLLINHPLECPVCDKGGECPLQDITFKYGLGESRMMEPKRVIPDTDINDFIRLNYKRCIHCKRCVRFHEEIAGDHLVEFARRGSDMFILPKEGDGVKSKFSGNQVEFCPVGALTSKPYRFSSRDWELAHTPSVSLSDAVGTNVMLHTRLGQIKRVWSRDNHEVDWGWLSDKDRFVYEALYSEKRIKKPLVRQTDGKFKETSWSEAIKYVVENLKLYVERDGAESISGIAGSKLTNEVYAIFRRLLTTHIGTMRYHFGPFINGICENPTEFLEAVMFDSTSWDKVTHSNVIFAWGVDLLEEAPVLALKIERDMEHGGAVLLTSNSHVTEGERHAAAKFHYPIRKQADALRLFINAIANPDNADKDVKPLIEYLLGARTIAVLVGNELLSAPDASELIDLVIKLCRNLRVKHAKDGVVEDRDHGVTPDVTFNPIFRDGNAVGALFFNHLKTIHSDSNSNGHEGAKLGLVRILNGMAKGESNFCYVVGSDPVKNFPDSKLARRAFEHCQFVVVQDQFVTQTAEYANVILPALTSQEDEGTVLSAEKRLQKLHKADVKYPNADSDFSILRKVLTELGIEIRATTVADYYNHMAHLIPAIACTDYEAIPLSGIDLEFVVLQEDGTQEPIGDYLTVDQPNGLSESAGLQGNLMVMIPKLYMFNGENHSIHAPHFRQAVGEPFCEISPLDADRLGISHLRRAELSSKIGGIELTVRVSTRVPAGHVLISDNLPNLRLADLVSLGEYTIVNLVATP